MYYSKIYDNYSENSTSLITDYSYEYSYEELKSPEVRELLNKTALDNQSCCISFGLNEQDLADSFLQQATKAGREDQLVVHHLVYGPYYDSDSDSEAELTDQQINCDRMDHAAEYACFLGSYVPVFCSVHNDGTHQVHVLFSTINPSTGEYHPDLWDQFLEFAR